MEEQEISKEEKAAKAQKERINKAMGAKPAPAAEVASEKMIEQHITTSTGKQKIKMILERKMQNGMIKRTLLGTKKA